MHETLGTQVDGSPQKGFKMVCTQCKNMIISISQTELRVEKKIKTKNGDIELEAKVKFCVLGWL